MIFTESNKITNTVWHISNYFDRSQVREYVSNLKSLSLEGKLTQLNCQWLLANLDLDAIQGLVDPTTIVNTKKDTLETFIESIEIINTGKNHPDGPHTFYIHNTDLDMAMTTDLNLSFNKQIQKLSDEIIKYANKKYEVDDWKLASRNHTLYPPMHCINPHTHGPETQISAIIPLNDKPIGGEGGDLCLIDGQRSRSLPLHLWLDDRVYNTGDGSGAIETRSPCLPKHILDKVTIDKFSSKIGEVFIMDDVYPQPGHEHPDSHRHQAGRIVGVVDKYIQNASWRTTAHCVSKVENWFRVAMILWFESSKVKGED